MTGNGWDVVRVEKFLAWAEEVSPPTITLNGMDCAALLRFCLSLTSDTRHDADARVAQLNDQIATLRQEIYQLRRKPAKSAHLKAALLDIRAQTERALGMSEPGGSNDAVN